MNKAKESSKTSSVELEKRLQDAERRAFYYQDFAEKAGIARLKETESLSRLLLERSRIKEELQQHRDHLEELVAQRTAELSKAVVQTQQLNIQLQQEMGERKKVENAIRESEETFRALAHNSPDVIMRFDRQFRHLYVNPMVESQTGIPPQNFIGKTHKELGFSPELIETWEKGIQQVFDTKSAHRVEFKLPNDTWIDWLLFPEFSEQNNVNAVITTARDITPYKKIEEVLRQEIIERKRSEEKQRVLETQLRQTQRLESLGRLAGGIAHDFNNILAIMLGHIELLSLDAIEGGEEHLALETVMQAGNRASDLIQQILLFSRSQDLHLVPTDLTLILRETIKLVQATISTSIAIHSNIQPICHPILADSSQIQQIVINLCVNAQHAMGEQRGTLEISLKEEFLNQEKARKLGIISGNYLKLLIKDTGHGISPQDQEHIFDPFFTTKQVGDGTGLGLAVVHGIVTGHSGIITVESDVGKGTAFSILFPVIDTPVVPEIIKETSNNIERGKGHILVVDDETDLINLYETALTKSGYQVTTCCQGEQALEKFQADPSRYNLVFTDQLMPGLTGIQLSQALLNIKPNIPIVLATGFSESISEQEIEKYGIRSFLQKPIKIQNLISTIRRLL